MSTTPIAMKYDMNPNVTPIGPYFLSFVITVSENTSLKTITMPSQHTPVAMADGSDSRQGILPPSRNQILNHQKTIRAASPIAPSSTGPPAPWTFGPAQLENTQNTLRAARS